MLPLSGKMNTFGDKKKKDEKQEPIFSIGSLICI